LNLDKKREFLVNLCYWLAIAAMVYLVLEYLLPVSVPVILGVLVAWLVVRITGRLHCSSRLLRILLSVLIYGVLGLLVALAAVQLVSGISGIIQWLPEFYENKIQPLVTLVYNWLAGHIRQLDPTLMGALEMLAEGLLSALKNGISSLSGAAVNLLSGLATGIPNLIFSLLAMIFSTIFTVGDYEKIAGFAAEHTPAPAGRIFRNIRIYLTDTLFVVIRSYALIMLLTFGELSILFSVFGIEHAVLKAAVIAFLDILPVLGTGGVMIPWAVTSLVLGYTRLGLELLLIYIIVTVVRNYVEPKIVGTQLGLHPIITLVSMFIGLRLFGFLGLFGFPVGISFLWKQKLEREAGDFSGPQ